MYCINEDGTLHYDEVWDGKYLDLYTQVKSLQRGSSNNLLYHFKKMKTYNSCEIVTEPHNKSFSLNGLMIVDAANDLHSKETQQEIINAKLITKDQYSYLKMLQDRSNLTPDQHWAMRRYEIESFYLLDVDESLIEEDQEGDTRVRIRSYETYKLDKDSLIQKDLSEQKKNSHITDRHNYAHHRELLYDLLKAASLADDNSLLLIGKPIHSEMLKDFVALFKARKHEIARLFDMDVNRDIDDKPMPQLSKVVKLIGLKLELIQKKKKEGKKLYFYAITQDSIDDISPHLNRRKDQGSRDQWHTDRENETENLLFDADSDQQEVFHHAKTAIKAFQKGDDPSDLNAIFKKAEPDIPWVTF